MRFQVPQFIEIEDKVIGPLTIKQFLYLAGSAGMAFVAWRLLPIFISILVIPAVAGLGLALAFYKVNNKPFIDLLESAFGFYTGSRLYIWKRTDKKIEPTQTNQTKTDHEPVYVPRLSESKLKELSWSLDVNEHLDGNRTSEEK